LPVAGALFFKPILGCIVNHVKSGSAVPDCRKLLPPIAGKKVEQSDSFIV
jgi:hypothetical protein